MSFNKEDCNFCPQDRGVFACHRGKLDAAEPERMPGEQNHVSGMEWGELASICMSGTRGTTDVPAEGQQGAMLGPNYEKVAFRSSGSECGVTLNWL